MKQNSVKSPHCTSFLSKRETQLIVERKYYQQVLKTNIRLVTAYCEKRKRKHTRTD
jgi:hypothetical protein